MSTYYRKRRAGNTKGNKNTYKRNTNDKKNRRSKRQRNIRKRKIAAFLTAAMLVLTAICLLTGFVFIIRGKKVYEAPDVREDYLTTNPYSRPGEELVEVKNVFVHYTANPGTTAAQNKSYFQNLAKTGETSASAHFIIGYEGEIIQCLPLNEIGYAVKGRNYDSVSIECCYVDESGQFTEQTRDSLITLLSYLLGRYNLKPKDILRHYDAGGKLCPKYYVEHEEQWQKLKEDVKEYIKENGRYIGKYDLQYGTEETGQAVNEEGEDTQ